MTALPMISHMIYDFSIAGIHLRCDVPFEMYISEETPEFLCAPMDSAPDFTFTFREVSAVSSPAVLNFRYQNIGFVYFDSGRDIYHYRSISDPPYVKISWRKDFPESLLCEYDVQYLHSLYTSRDMFNLLSLELFLLHFGGLLLHCSFIRVDKRGILFTAPSGTGKSTQASLWERYAGADVLNGDRAALRCCAQGWTAWGLPYAGTSGIYRNESAPISALVVLRQAHENSVRRLTASEAIRYIYPELTLHRWDPDFVDGALCLLFELLKQVPVFLLACTPDEAAVNTLKQKMIEGGILS